MHIKDILNQKEEAVRSKLEQSIRRQISAVIPAAIKFNMLGFPEFKDPTGCLKGGQNPHQGDGEIERRRKRIATGKLTEADGLVRRKE